MRRPANPYGPSGAIGLARLPPVVCFSVRVVKCLGPPAGWVVRDSKGPGPARHLVVLRPVRRAAHVLPQILEMVEWRSCCFPWENLVIIVSFVSLFGMINNNISFHIFG